MDAERNPCSEQGGDKGEIGCRALKKYVKVAPVQLWSRKGIYHKNGREKRIRNKKG